jgi:hypothetical protein
MLEFYVSGLIYVSQSYCSFGIINSNMDEENRCLRNKVNFSGATNKEVISHTSIFYCTILFCHIQKSNKNIKNNVDK